MKEGVSTVDCDHFSSLKNKLHYRSFKNCSIDILSKEWNTTATERKRNVAFQLPIFAFSLSVSSIRSFALKGSILYTEVDEATEQYLHWGNSASFSYRFHALIRHWGHHDGCRMRSRKCLPFQSTWFHLWFS